MENCSTTVRSQDEFSTLFISGAQMWTVNVTTSKRIDAIVTLEQALAVQDAADPEVVLRYYPGRLDPSRLDNLESYRDNCATGLEQQSCTRGVARSGFMRPLTVINDGHSVKFQSKTTDGELDDIIQVDGLLLHHEAVVMNEVCQNSPSLKQVQEVRPRATTLLGVVTGLMFAPDDIVTDPACVKNEIVNWLATVNKTMVLRGVVPVMSGSNFAPDVEEECRDKGIYVCRSNGADWSVSR